MYLDKHLQFSILQEETTQAAHISDHVYDLTHIPLNIINGMTLVFRIATAIVSAGGGTLQIDLVTSAAVGLSTPQTLWSTGIVATGTVVGWSANSIVYSVRMPVVNLLQYMGMIFTIGTAVFTAGTWDAFLTPDAPYHIAATP